MIQQRKKRNSSKVNLTISLIFHTVLIGVIFYFAAKEGLLGKKMRSLTAVLDKPKKIEQEKPKPPEPKVEHKTEEAKASVPQPKMQNVAPPPPSATVAPEAAPPPATLPAIAFDEGAIAVDTMSGDPNSMYKALVEHTLKSYWNRPEDGADDNYTADVELTIDKTGYVEDSRWVSGSGNTQWDQSVKDAVSQLKAISRPPPKGFPEKFTVRFDVETTKTEALQFGSR